MFINKNLYINISKKKAKCHYWGTTHTTSLKPALPVTNLLYPLTFSVGTTGVQQHTTFLFSPTAIRLYLLFTAFCDLLFVAGTFILFQN
jgi:hypothetical protein